MKWYASVNFGLEQFIGGILTQYGAKNVETMDGAVIFSCEKPIGVRCVNNLYAVLAVFDAETVEKAAAAAARLNFTPPTVNGGTFRIIVMDRGRLRAIGESLMRDMEKNVARRTGLRARRANPDIEIWLNRRNDGATFFMARIGKRPPFEKFLKKGELRPDVADAMLRMAKTGRRSVIADPFGGWGAIAAAAAYVPYKSIYTGDINDECVDYQKKRFANARGCYVQQWDALKLPLDDASADAVVTDPPWGEYAAVDLNALYAGFIQEAARILKPGGALVFLTSAETTARRTLAEHGFDYETVPLKINGKDAFIFDARRG